MGKETARELARMGTTVILSPSFYSDRTAAGAHNLGGLPSYWM